MSIESPMPAGELGAGSGAQLTLQAVYLKDCSFEAPQGPRVTSDWNPQIGLDLNTAVSVIEGELREVKQAGAFLMQNLSDSDFRRAAGVVCPGVLFPYVRQVVSQLVSQGGFPQLLLPPVNFEALFAANNPDPASAATN
jgi:preprotein translocase subunit SecB